MKAGKLEHTHTHTRIDTYGNRIYKVKLCEVLVVQVCVQGGGTKRLQFLEELQAPSLLSKLSGETKGSSNAFRKAEHATTHVHTSRN